MTIPNGTTHGTASDIHRLLDEAFTGIEMNPERQDLKEEMRANLVARVAELEASGLAPGAAARAAIDEFGDVRTAVDTITDTSRTAPAWAQHRVRPNPRFVVRTVVLATIAVAALAILVLAEGGRAISYGVRFAAVIAIALSLGVTTADALRQETTSNHPMPTGRAAGYGAATALGLTGLGFGWLYLRSSHLPWLVGGVLAVAAAVVALTYLGATQTNRHKPWVMRLQASHMEAGDRFANDPAAAARFGLYTGTTWLIALAAFAALTLTVGWVWSWLALVAAVAVTMITLARMLFAEHPKTGDRHAEPASCQDSV